VLDLTGFINLSKWGRGQSVVGSNDAVSALHSLNVFNIELNGINKFDAHDQNIKIKMYIIFISPFSQTWMQVKSPVLLISSALSW
jgi:hypothetical protein